MRASMNNQWINKSKTTISYQFASFLSDKNEALNPLNICELPSNRSANKITKISKNSYLIDYKIDLSNWESEFEDLSTGINIINLIL